MSKTHLQLETEERDRRIAAEQVEARLSAAAPQMLEALKAVEADEYWQKRIASAEYGFGTDTPYGQTPLKIKAAIRLAETGKP